MKSVQMEDLMFSLVRPATTGSKGARLGKILRAGRDAFGTPNYLAATSRGVVPHLTPDTIIRSTSIAGAYASLEDFVERAPTHTPPVCQFPSTESSLGRMKQFTRLPPKTLLVLGSRRSPPLVAPPASSNTNKSIAISTSVGFRFLKAEDYAQHAEELGVDIVVGLADVPYGRALGSKRIEAATDRSIEWFQDHIAHRRLSSGPKARLFASLLPVPSTNQQYYIEAVEEALQDVDGLAFYSLAPIEDLPASLQALPRLALTEVRTPMQILQQVQCGMDVFVVPFIDAITDSGMAFAFDFTPAEGSHGAETFPLAVDMWSPDHSTDLSPITPGCQCYACTNHHRAYIQHLLSAKEMLGWVLIQIHNHHTIERFFQSIRSSIESNTFTSNVEAFARRYDPEFPQTTGQGPRIRGYQRKSEGRGEPKPNRPAFAKYTSSSSSQASPSERAATTTNAPRVDILAGDFNLALLDEQNEIDAQDKPDLESSGDLQVDGPKM